MRIVPKLSVAGGINATRTVFPTMWFDATKCVDGIQAFSAPAPQNSAQVLDAQVRDLKAAGAEKIFHEQVHPWRSG